MRHEADAFSWAMQQASLLRDRQFDLIDVDHLADHYLADKLRSDMVCLLQNVMKGDHQPTRRSRSWSLSIREHRRRVERHLRQAPGLRSILAETLADAYLSARDAALAQTDLPESALSETCPYSWDEITTRPIDWPGQP